MPSGEADAAGDAIVGGQLGVILLQGVEPNSRPLYTIARPAQPVLPLTLFERIGLRLVIVPHPVEHPDQLQVSFVAVQVLVVVFAEHLDRVFAPRTLLSGRHPSFAGITVVRVRHPTPEARSFVSWRNLARLRHRFLGGAWRLWWLFVFSRSPRRRLLR